MANDSIDQAKYFLNVACDEAVKGVTTNEGGPFGAVVVRNGEIIAQGHNCVFQDNDPTAHAEVIAIRKATAKLGTFSLSGCILYSSCEPCPMCFSACLWARIEKVYYACTQSDAAEFGFDDAFFYGVVSDQKKRAEYAVPITVENATHPMKIWKEKEDKVQY